MRCDVESRSARSRGYEEEAMGSSAMSGGSSAAGLRVLAVLLGVFILSMGIDKRAWLTDSGILLGLLQEWSASAGIINRWYLCTTSESKI